MPLPPGPRSLIPFRRLRAFGRDRLGFLERVAREHGDVAYMAEAGLRFGFLNHPDVIRDVLVTRARDFAKGIGLERSKLLLGEGLLTSEGPFHMRQRRLMQPAFHRERIAAYGAIMTEYAARHSAQWRSGEELAAEREMNALTLAIAGKTLFDTDVHAEIATIGRALDTAIASFALVLMPGGESLARLPIPAAQRFRRARAEIDAVIYRLIRERRAERATGGADRGDLLTMLLDAQDEEAASGADVRMTDVQVRDEALTILLAGHETTANALAWTWHFVASHPEVERELHAEVDAVLTDGSASRAATSADVARLPYTRAIVAEAMRLRPPAYVLGRKALVPYAVPGTRYTIPAGTTVFLSQHVVHRDARWWPDPERFDPSRWMGDAPSDRPRFAYFPFGAGSRICIGEQFAWMELVLVVATVAREWRLRAMPGVAPSAEPVITLRAKGVRLVAERR